MLKNNLLFILTCGFISIAHAAQLDESQTMLIQLPDAQTLNNRFLAENLGFFTKNTTIVSQLAESKLNIEGIVINVELALDDFRSYMNNPHVDKVIWALRDKTFEIVLQDSPEALIKLKEYLTQLENQSKQLMSRL